MDLSLITLHIFKLFVSVCPLLLTARLLSRHSAWEHYNYILLLQLSVGVQMRRLGMNDGSCNENIYYSLLASKVFHRAVSESSLLRIFANQTAF